MKSLTNHQILSNFSPKFLENASNKHFLDSVIDGGARDINQTLDKFWSHTQFSEGGSHINNSVPLTMMEANGHRGGQVNTPTGEGVRKVPQRKYVELSRRMNMR